MTATFYGADVVELRTLADKFDSAASSLRAAKNKVGNGIQISAWVGPYAVKFRAQWSSQSSVQLESAAQTLNDSASALRRNATEQEGASSVVGGSSLVGSFARGGGGPSADPGFFTGKYAWLEDIDKGSQAVSLVGDLAEKVPRAFGAIWALANTTERSSGAFGAAIDYGIAQGPKWLSAASRFMNNPVVDEVGSGLSVVGAGFAVAGAVQAWTDPASSTWNKTETTVSAALAIASAIPEPAEPIIAGVALAWTAGTTIYDNRAAIGSFVSETSQDLSLGASVIERTTAPVVTQAIAGAVAAGEKTASGIAKDVTGFVGSIGSIF